MIAKEARKTVRYIERNVSSFPNQYKVIRDRIINSSYDILRGIYKANITGNLSDKKDIVIDIQMLNFYLEEALRKDLININKFEIYIKHLTSLDLMVRSWFKYEKSKQYI